MLEEASPGSVKDKRFLGCLVIQTKTFIRAQKQCLSWRKRTSMGHAIPALVQRREKGPWASLCLAQSTASDWTCFLPGSAVAGRQFSMSWQIFISFTCGNIDCHSPKAGRPRHLDGLPGVCFMSHIWKALASKISQRGPRFVARQMSGVRPVSV